MALTAYECTFWFLYEYMKTLLRIPFLYFYALPLYKLHTQNMKPKTTTSVSLSSFLCDLLLYVYDIYVWHYLSDSFKPNITFQQYDSYLIYAIIYENVLVAPPSVEKGNRFRCQWQNLFWELSEQIDIVDDAIFDWTLYCDLILSANNCFQACCANKKNFPIQIIVTCFRFTCEISTL